MDTRTLGSLDVSVVGLGCNNFGGRLDQTATDAVVGAALDAEVTLFDTADAYGGTRSEELLGAALGKRRDQAVVATKFGMRLGDDPATGGASPAWVERAVTDSLRRLGTDRIDLYQLHTPDEATPIEDTLVALDRLVQAGKVLEVGCSNFSAGQIDAAAQASAEHGLARFVSVQNRYSLLTRDPEQGVTDACKRHGLGILPYFPLESGMLSGKYRAGEDPPAGTRLAGMGDRAGKFRNERTVAAVERLRGYCEERGHTLLELAFSWLLCQPTVASVIAGGTRPEQVQANVAAAGWTLTDAELADVDHLLADVDRQLADG